MIYFLRRFRSYLEGAELEILSDNQFIYRSFTKPVLSRRKSRWLEFLGILGIKKMFLISGKVRVLEGALSRAPRITVNSIETSNNAHCSIQLSPGLGCPQTTTPINFLHLSLMPCAENYLKKTFNVIGLEYSTQVLK